MTPPNDELCDLTKNHIDAALTILQNKSLASPEKVPPQVQRLLDGGEAVCRSVGCKDATPLSLAYLQQVSRLVEFARPLQEALQLIVRRAEILGVIGRYVDFRFKSFTSSFGKWWPKHLHGNSADFGAYLEGENDLLAARVVALTLGDVVKIARLILGSEQFGWDRADVRNFYHDAKDGKYRSWHLKARFRPRGKDTFAQCEVQLRTGLEDIVHEIDHHLAYKRPPGTSDQGWIIWKTLSDNEFADLSRTIYNIAVTLDRKWQMKGILQSIGTPELRAFCDKPRRHGVIEDHVRHFEHTKVVAANLSTGLAERQTEIEFDSKGFVGLVRQSPEATAGFDWETGALDFSRADIFNFDRLEPTDQLVLVTQGCKKDFDKLNQCKSDLLQLWLNLWRAASEAADKRHSFHRGQRWFNEYESRLNDVKVSGNPYCASALALKLTRTNFAYEVCTNYPWDGSRILISDDTGNTDASVKPHMEMLQKALHHYSDRNLFGIRTHGANPIGVHVNLISVHDEGMPVLVVTRRGDNVSSDPGKWQTSASGSTCPRHSSIEWGGDIPGYVYDAEASSAKPSVFIAAQREVEEELGVFVPIDNIRIIALLDHTSSGQPILVAEAYTDLPIEEIKRLALVAEEKWETGDDGIDAIYLMPDNCRSLIAGNSVETVAGSPLAPIVQGNVPSTLWQERSQVAVLLTLLRFAE